MTKQATPKTLQDAIVYFSNPENCLNYLSARRWPNGVICPTCGRDDVTFLEKQGKWQCKSAHKRRQFSVKVGTIFEDSPLGLDKWLTAIWMITNCKNGVSSYEVHRAIGVTQKTAWFMVHRIRVAMQTGSFEKKMGGEGGAVEADETFIGGLSRNMHKDVRERRITGPGGSGKVIVMGLLERHGEGSKVRTRIVLDRSEGTMQGVVRDNVESGCEVMTDAHRSYMGLRADYVHQFVDHAEEYVRGNVHTNGIENFWSLLKRSIKGTYVSVEPFHLFRYLDEQSFRFNERKGKDGDRFHKVTGQLAGKHLTYSELTGKAEAEGDKSH
ncbi:MAG TPA: IS1595 family transposase [Pyrinomonadaceae bacterium]|nr:IS1595 family transposase [Pyrinomonadaceae bacterium]